ncbi:MAG TPA: hypothetical protein VN697_01555 [Tepidiformaceae bacterium]|nr:hypothetical protein [Tepidiformaceae bacterium]
MDWMTVDELETQFPGLLAALGEDGIVVDYGRGVTRLLKAVVPENHGYLIGSLKDLIVVDEEDDLFSTGAWVSDEWGDLNVPPLADNAQR